MTDEVSKKKYGSYYAFIFLSSIIGFFMLFFLSRTLLSSDNVKNLNALFYNSRSIVSAIAAISATIIFLIISIRFKDVLRKFYFSEIFLYLYVGFLTTLVNVIAFELIRQNIVKSVKTSSSGWKLAEILAFLIAVIFAFVANKFFVFKSISFAIKKLFSEFWKFVAARVVTEVINFAIMWFMIDMHKMGEFLSKVIASVVVIVLNYICSKFLIFKKDV